MLTVLGMPELEAQPIKRWAQPVMTSEMVGLGGGSPSTQTFSTACIADVQLQGFNSLQH